MRFAPTVGFAALVACSSTASSKAGPDPQTVRAQIDSLDAKFNRWVVAGHVDSIVSDYYAPDAILLVAGSPPMRGTEAIRAVYDGFYKIGNVRGRIQLYSLLAADSIATDVGQYTMEIRDKSDSTKLLATDHGSYTTAFVRRNGEWRAIFDGTVSEVPALTAPSKDGAKK